VATGGTHVWRTMVRCCVPFSATHNQVAPMAHYRACLICEDEGCAALASVISGICSACGQMVCAMYDAATKGDVAALGQLIDSFPGAVDIGCVEVSASLWCCFLSRSVHLHIHRAGQHGYYCGHTCRVHCHLWRISRTTAIPLLPPPHPPPTPIPWSNPLIRTHTHTHPICSTDALPSTLQPRGGRWCACGCSSFMVPTQ
jgi:hypothetical protein